LPPTGPVRVRDKKPEMKPGADSKIWVVLPDYNEERALPALLDSLLENLGGTGRTVLDGEMKTKTIGLIHLRSGYFL
jgi:hypothetical protein